ncbi:MAG: hypothetical protein LBC80_00460 [Treponema sp.]|jgi:hypothetical protein|nr:hypothetical protein [Treponema sp.]
MNDFIEQKIVSAVRGLITGRVNEIMLNWNFIIPLFEFCSYKGSTAITPTITLVSCEQTEKERIIKLDTYSMTISISTPENPESELYCYGYVYAFEKALNEDVTLGGIADRAVIVNKKYVPPKAPNCGDMWELVLTLRVVVEKMRSGE